MMKSQELNIIIIPNKIYVPLESLGGAFTGINFSA